MQPVSEFPPGFFFIRCKAQKFAMDVNGGSMIVILTNSPRLNKNTRPYTSSLE